MKKKLWNVWKIGHTCTQWYAHSQCVSSPTESIEQINNCTHLHTHTHTHHLRSQSEEELPQLDTCLRMKELSGHILLFLTHSAAMLTHTHTHTHVHKHSVHSIPLDWLPVKFDMESKLFGGFQHSSASRRWKQRQRPKRVAKHKLCRCSFCLSTAIPFSWDVVFVYHSAHLYATRHRCSDTKIHTTIRIVCLLTTSETSVMWWARLIKCILFLLHVNFMSSKVL